MARPPATLLCAILALPACPDDTSETTSAATTTATGGPSCDLPFLGDPSLEPVMEFFYLGADGADHPCAPSGPIDIIEPPQGGRVLFVGVRATNVDPCGALLTGALRDLQTNQVRFDTRSINLRDDGAGYGRSAQADIASYANIPVCHNTWSDQDIFGVPFQLEVTLQDRRGKQVMGSLVVEPVCAEPANAPQCLCICDGDYVLGDACGAGGAGVGGAGGSG